MEKYRELITTLADCIRACEYCATACLNEDDVQKLTDCIRLDRDCADLCNLSLKFLSRESSQVYAAVELCKKTCSQCAMECENHEHDHCVKCAEACRKCEEQCESFLNQYKEINKM